MPKDTKGAGAQRKKSTASAAKHSSGTAVKKAQNSESIGIRHEITGVLLFAFGVFLGISMYALESSVIGDFITKLLLGCFGIYGYALPFVFIALGIARILVADSVSPRFTMTCSLVCVLLILTLTHIILCTPNGSNGILDYYKYSYAFGKASRGAGVIGALLAYPLNLFLGKTGSIIFLIAGILICVLLITRISIRHMSSSVKNGIKNKREKIQQEIDDEFIFTPDDKPVKHKQNFRDDDLIIVPQKKQKVKARKLKASKKPGANQKVTLKESDRDIEFIPLEGALNKKKRAGVSFSSGMAQNDAPMYEEKPAQAEEVHSDPFDSIPIEKFTPDIPAEVPVFPAMQTPVRKPDTQSSKAAQIQAFDVPEDTGTPKYRHPPIDCLNRAKAANISSETPTETAKLLLSTLESFKISAKVTNICVGPVVTRYELQPASGIRVNRITSLSNDIALALAAQRVRIEAPIPGKAAIGIEIPNKQRTMVGLREVLESNEFLASKSSLTFALGRDIAGKTVTADLSKMPHLLIAGSTGSGKSVCINDIIVSLIYKSAPEDVRLILVDPKVVELHMFSQLPHLLVPVVTDAKKAAGALRWAVNEMEQRYNNMPQKNARDIETYNARVDDPSERLPKIVIVIDELNDLMMVAAKEVEESICRIAQLGRACGIHLIVATQRPSADVITGLIKANIPSRIAFAVSSAINSNIILDSSGAEKLIGNGDMLFHANGANKPNRIQGSFVSIEEIERIMAFFEQDGQGASFDEDANNTIASTALQNGVQKGEEKQLKQPNEDELLPDAVKILIESKQASISMLQRRLSIGYARAARLIDIMERRGIVSEYDGSKPRKLLIDYMQYQQMFGMSAMLPIDDEQ